MKQLITGHNKKVISTSEGRVGLEDYNCKCGGVDQCQLGGHCRVESIVYQATVTMEEEVKTYVGQTKNSFKSRVALHHSDNNCGRRRTGLNTYIIDMKRQGKEPISVHWNVVKRAKQRRRGDRLCQLCLSEKAHILRADPRMTLNKRSELMQRCRHKDELMLSNFYSRSTVRGRRPGRPQRNDLLEEDSEGEERRPEGGGRPLEEEGGPDEGGRQDGGGGQTEEEGGPMEEEEDPSVNPRNLRRRPALNYRIFF